MRALRMKDVILRVGYRESAIRKMVIEGQFPAPFKLGGRAIAWLEQDVDDWIAARAANRVMYWVPMKLKNGEPQ